MSGGICPVLLAGVIGEELEPQDKERLAQCIEAACAWWSEKYGMCYVEMIMLRA